MRPFRTHVFLYRMLASIFVVEAIFLAIAFTKCKTPDNCPKLGDRSETLFTAAIATTLSLLTGAAVLKTPQSSDDDRDASAEPPQPQPSPPARGRASGQVSRKES